MNLTLNQKRKNWVRLFLCLLLLVHPDMNSTQLNHEQSQLLISTCPEAAVDQNFIEEIQTSSTETNPPKSTRLEKPETFSNEPKKESIIEADDSFDVFVPLKVKNYSNGLKKSNYASSNSRLKKKTVTSSNRICPYFSTRKSPTSSKEDRDLKLAIARSLEDQSPIKPSGPVLSDLNEKKTVKQSSNFLKSLTSKSKKLNTNTLLFRRTGEERQNIITKKIGILLLEKENIHVEFLEKVEIDLISSSLEGVWDKDSTLWERSKVDVDNLAKFYVPRLEKFFYQIPVTSTMSATSSVEENDNGEVPTDVMDIKTNDDTIHSKSNKIKEENVSEDNSNCEIDFSNCNIDSREEFLADSLNVLSDNLFSFYNSSELSDFNVILKTGESLPCHQFMLQARCPNLLSDVLTSEASNSLDFSQYSAQATRAFFKYIYSGKVDFVYSLPGEDKTDLYVLSKKYKLTFLENFLLKSFSSDSFHVYSQSTCSPPRSPSGYSPDSSPGPKEIIPDKRSSYPTLTHESHIKSDGKFSNSKENQDMRLSFSNLAESINNLASTSGLNSSQNISKQTYASAANDSMYDIFKDDIKSPCNSSLLSQGLFQSKRKLDYTDVQKETKKICSFNIPEKKQDSPEIVTIDSDSNESCPNIFQNSLLNTSIAQTSFLENYNKQPMIESSSSNSSDFNITDFFGKKEEVSTNLTEISKVKTPSEASYSVKRSPSIARATSVNKDRSVDKYFEASFPEVVITPEIKAVRSMGDLVTPPGNSILKKKTLTPLQELIISEATPEPDYSAMISPELKFELRKYGIKPELDRMKARILLRYIYSQVHPVKATLPKHVEEPVPSTSLVRTSPIIISDDDSNQSDTADRRTDSENDFAYEEYLFNQSIEKNEFSPNQIGSDLKKTINNFIKSDSVLFGSVLLFRPLLLKKFYKTVREHGVKCSLHELMEVLDDLCVNYHVEKKENSTQKRKYKKKTVGRKEQKTS